jgi:hypothetical protein
MDKAEIWLLFLFFGFFLLPFRTSEQRMRRKMGMMKKPLGLPEISSSSGNDRSKTPNPKLAHS